MLKALEAELDSLAEYANEMSRAKIFTNPYGRARTHGEPISHQSPPRLTTLFPYPRYSRFEMSSLLEAMDLCQEAYDGRDEQLKGALADQQKIDEAKRSFAAAAEVVVAFCKEEKGSMEAEAPAIQITPDDGAAIVKGKEMLATLEGYSGAARGKRAAQLAPAQAVGFLMNASEMDNKYTEYTVYQLKEGAMEQLEQQIRDKMTFVEAQLARAQADITPEQHAELKASFEHFDKDKSGMLNKDEFTAAIRSLDLSSPRRRRRPPSRSSPRAEGRRRDAPPHRLRMLHHLRPPTVQGQRHAGGPRRRVQRRRRRQDVVLAAELNATMKPPDAASSSTASR